MYAFTVCMWLKSSASPGIGTPFSYGVPGQANEIVLIEWGNNPIELLVNDKVGPQQETGEQCSLIICWQRIATLTLPWFSEEGRCIQQLRIIHYSPGSTASSNDGSKSRSAAVLMKCKEHMNMLTLLCSVVQNKRTVCTFDNNHDTAEGRLTDHLWIINFALYKHFISLTHIPHQE